MNTEDMNYWCPLVLTFKGCNVPFVILVYLVYFPVVFWVNTAQLWTGREMLMHRFDIPAMNHEIATHAQNQTVS